MSVRILIIDADPADLPAVLSAVQGRASVAPVIDATPVLALPAPAQAQKRVGRSVGRSVGTKRVPRRASAERMATGESDEAILAALRFRPMRVTELADALCPDKRDIRKAVPRLYSKLKRLERDGQVAKIGREFSVKRK